LARVKVCKSCKAEFAPVKPLQAACGPLCAFEYARQARIKRESKAARDAVKALRAKTELSRTNPKSGPKRAAIGAVHRFISARDHHKPCIVHGHECENTAFDAGHFQSAGSRQELRFNTWNIHKQCSLNNRGSHKRSRYLGEGTAAIYERNLVHRIGQERVDWLKGPHEPKQYREQDFKRIARIFSRRAKHYRKLRGIE